MTALAVLLIIVASMSLGIFLETRAQARALQTLSQVANDWLVMEVRRARREAGEMAFDKGRALRWLGDLIGEPITDVRQIYEEFLAVEVMILNGEAQRTALVTALPEDEFRRRVKQARKASRLEARIAAPVLPRRARVSSASLTSDWAYFDLEAEAVGKVLGLNWGRPGRLWVWQGK